MRKPRLSIKTRVGIWYAGFIVVIIAAVAIIITYITNNTIIENAKSGLTDTVDRAVDDIRISDGKLSIGPDLVYHDKNTYVALYSIEGLDISGLLPDDFDEDTEFVDDEIRMIGERGNRYYVFDRLIENPHSYDIWVRGVMSAELEDIAPDFLIILRLSLLIFLGLTVITILGGIIITRRAFRPLKTITDTAEQITESGDLSRRIGTGDKKSRDEIIRAAGVFDEMLDKLDDSFENQKRFTNDASHELRTPTAVIMATSEYALENTDDKEEMIDSLKTIHTESKNMNKLVSQLLTLARADTKTLIVNKEKTDISLLAEERVEMDRRIAEAKGITIIADCEEGVYMDADPILFGRIYENLISNAIKYGKENGHIWVSVKSEPVDSKDIKDEEKADQNDEIKSDRNAEDGIAKKTTEKTDKKSERIHICLRDDGEGISEEALPHIFERFYRENRTFAKESTGLGLSIVKWIVEEHGGEITCTSTKGKGARFDIIFQ